MLTRSIKYRTEISEPSTRRSKPDPEYLTTNETAKILRCSSETVRRLAKSGKLTGFLVGSQFRFKRSYILSLGGDLSSGTSPD